jgi:hypothetical protein
MLLGLESIKLSKRDRTMRKNIEKVLNAFRAGNVASGQTCSTDGSRVYSYNMCIAGRLIDGTIVVCPLNESPSRTTSGHIRAVIDFFGDKAKFSDNWENF